MNLRDWDRREVTNCIEIIEKVHGKLGKRKRIDIIEDLVPELGILKDKSYCALATVPGSIEYCERNPAQNLGFLLQTGLYEHVVLPIRICCDKETFEEEYGLSENRGCHLNYDQFVSLVKSGKVIIVLGALPSSYKASFYKDIFKNCDELPVFPQMRVYEFLMHDRMTRFAISEQIRQSKDWEKEILKLHPELKIGNSEKEIRQVFYEKLPEMANTVGRTIDDVRGLLVNQLYALRAFGFDKLAELSIRIGQVDANLGAAALAGFGRYIISPISDCVLAINNYSNFDMLLMSFLKILPKKLGIVWKDILSAAPISSSAVSEQIQLEMPQLRGPELLEAVEMLDDNENASALRKNALAINKSLSNFDLSHANKSFEKVDEIISESINAEFRDYAKKARISTHLLRLGKTFTKATSEGLLVISGLAAGTGSFQWGATALAGSALPMWLSEKLCETKSEDIVRWWSQTWPFEDTGIGFVLWQETQKRKKNSRIER